jgi:hypothetical protein
MILFLVSSWQALLLMAFCLVGFTFLALFSAGCAIMSLFLGIL